MSKAAILLGGDLSDPVRVRQAIADSAHIIAADSGARHALALELLLHHLVGDMDSIDPALLADLRKQNGVQIHPYPEDKDQTDAELAIELARDLGANAIHLVGNEGGRMDHLLAGITILGAERYRHVALWLHGRGERLTALRSGQSLRLTTTPGRRVSLIALSTVARGVDLSGVHWPLADQTLELGSSLSISNRATETEIAVAVREGTIIVCLEE